MDSEPSQKLVLLASRARVVTKKYGHEWTFDYTTRTRFHDRVRRSSRDCLLRWTPAKEIRGLRSSRKDRFGNKCRSEGISWISRFWHLFRDPKKRHFFAISEGSKIDFLEGMSKTSSGTPFSEGSKTGFHIRSRAHSVVHETHKLTATFDPGS